MIVILQIKRINGREYYLTPEDRELDTVADLEAYRKELEKLYHCEIDFTWKEK